jgi:SAM-dependent methyltransferase
MKRTLRVPDRLRRALPALWRRRIRTLVTEIPWRLRDAIPDARDPLRSPETRLPPAHLRRRVSQTSSRREFESAGERVAADVMRAFESSQRVGREYRRWLDFGCGSGRIERHVARLAGACEMYGADVDREAISWLARRRPDGRFSVIDSAPPTPFPSSFFDVIYVISVFTHFDEAAEGAWLAELVRLLAPGALLIVSTLSPNLTFERPDLTESQLCELQRTGFLFAPGKSRFNENTAFATRARLESVWGARLELRSFEEHGLARYQDLSVWEKP